MIDPSYYFDHGATTPLRREALEAMLPYFSERFGNPGSLHQFGLQAREALEAARATVARSLGAKPREIVFTGSGTEANNLAILGTARRLRRLGKGKHLITSRIEHASALKCFQHLEQEGFEVTYLPVDAYGLVAPESLMEAVRPDTILVSIMHANNVIGTVQPIRQMGMFLRERGIPFHTDAIQSYGKIPVDVNDLSVDLLSVNAHKIGGPKGVAALYVRNGIRLDPALFGGGQERGLRPATQNVAGIVGFAAAVECMMREFPGESERLRRLRKQLIEELRSTVDGVRINGHPDQSLPNLVNIAVEGIEGQGLMLELDRRGFAVSSASACSSTDSEPSYVLLAVDPDRQRALEGLRITLGRTNTEESVRELVKALREGVAHWRKGKRS